jgi:hypothetical protein
MSGISELIDRRIEAERKLIADWMRKVAANLVKSQSDCLLANADIIEENRYVVERGEYKSEGNGG